MVEIRYGDHNQLADLAGKSVVEVRELYKSEFGLPNRARAILNGQKLKKEQEPEIKLTDEDELSFEKKNRKGLVLLGAFLLTLMVSGSLFAYTMTSDSITLGITGGVTDYGNVTDNSSTVTWTLLGRHRGAIPAGMLFDVTVEPTYSGDLAVNVYLANADDLSKDYSAWVMRVELTNAAGSPTDCDATTQLLTLDNAMVTFEVDVGANMTATEGYTAYVRCDGGFYKTFRWGWLGPEDPIIWAQLLQAGNH